MKFGLKAYKNCPNKLEPKLNDPFQKGRDFSTCCLSGEFLPNPVTLDMGEGERLTVPT